MNDSTVRWAHVPAFAFATQQKDTAFFDQLSGKDLKAFFKEGRLGSGGCQWKCTDYFLSPRKRFNIYRAELCRK